MSGSGAIEPKAEPEARARERAEGRGAALDRGAGFATREGGAFKAPGGEREGRLGGAFARAAAERRAALIGYLPAGFPSVEVAIAAATVMAKAGADIVEIGLPYSDPLMDGPVIQEAVHQALLAGTRVADVFRTVEAVAATGVPVLVMTYWNPVDHYGVARFASDLAGAGGCGLITPDLPPEEAGPWLAAAATHQLDPVFLVAPSSTEQRLALITAACRGFVYAASVLGVTGAREHVGEAASGLVARVRQHCGLPVAIGLGVSSAAQAAQVAGFADGVIVGSAFVRRVLDAASAEDACASVASLTAELAAGVRAHAGSSVAGHAQSIAAQPR